MGSVANSLSGLSYLTQPGGPLSTLPEGVSTSDLQSASPQDLVSMSTAALQTQEVDDAFGLSQTPPPTAGYEIPGVTTTDLTDATPQQQASFNDQAQQLQEVQSLFSTPTSTTGTTNVLA
jgi:hypothetical protein